MTKKYVEQNFISYVNETIVNDKEPRALQICAMIAQIY